MERSARDSVKELIGCNLTSYILLSVYEGFAEFFGSFFSRLERKTLFKIFLFIYSHKFPPNFTIFTFDFSQSIPNCFFLVEDSMSSQTFIHPCSRGFPASEIPHADFGNPRHMPSAVKVMRMMVLRAWTANRMWLQCEFGERGGLRGAGALPHVGVKHIKCLLNGLRWNSITPTSTSGALH